MGMDALTQGEIETIVGRLYRIAGFNDVAPVPPPRLARALLGPRSVRLIERSAIRGSAVLARVRGEWRIYVREDLDQQERLFCVAHELGEWAVGEEAGYVEEREGVDLEQSSDRIAGAIMLPRRAALKAYGKVRKNWTQLALAFGTSESCAALRYSEVTNEPLVLLTPNSARRRGDWIPWPREVDLRSNERHPGIVKAQLRDDPQRFVAMQEGPR